MNRFATLIMALALTACATTGNQSVEYPETTRVADSATHLRPSGEQFQTVGLPGSNRLFIYGHDTAGITICRSVPDCKSYLGDDDDKCVDFSRCNNIGKPTHYMSTYVRDRKAFNFGFQNILGGHSMCHMNYECPLATTNDATAYAHCVDYHACNPIDGIPDDGRWKPMDEPIPPEWMLDDEPNECDDCPNEDAGAAPTKKPIWYGYMVINYFDFERMSPRIAFMGFPGPQLDMSDVLAVQDGVRDGNRYLFANPPLGVFQTVMIYADGRVDAFMEDDQGCRIYAKIHAGREMGFHPAGTNVTGRIFRAHLAGGPSRLEGTCSHMYE